jgi:uncharacterized BrkB/YihY/UPF0761 family membrane protein
VPVTEVDEADEQRPALAAVTARFEMLTRWVDAFQQRNTVAGFCYAVIKKYGDDNGGRQAALITYFGFLSLFPILLLAVATVTAVLANDPQLRARILVEVVPPALRETVDNALTSLPSGAVPLTIGVVGLLLSASGVVNSAQDTLNRIAAVPVREQFGFVPRTLRGALMVLVLLLSVLSIGVLAVVSAELPDVGGVPRIASAVGALLVCFVLLLAAAKMLLARPAPFVALWPAAALGAAVITATLLILGPLLAHFVARSGPVYGSFATVIGILALLLLVTQALVYTAEIAAVHRARLWPRALDTRHPTDADRRALTLLARRQLRTPTQDITVSFTPPPDTPSTAVEEGQSPTR